MGNEKKPKTGNARLWQLASTKKALVITSCVLAVLSTACSFSPFIAIYFIIRELLAHVADLSQLNTAYMTQMGWLAAGGAILTIVLNFLALMCSHIAAFKTLYKLKLTFTMHLASLSLGFHTQNSTGKLRKVVDENIEKLEGFIAHQLPDLVGSFATPIVVLIILFVFDWRLGLASLVPIVLSYGVQMTLYGKDGAKKYLKLYQDSLEDMNNAAVEYVRGISVVKAFNQTIFSFRKFYDMIKTYGREVMAYTMWCENYMATFMVIVQNVYLFLMPVIILLVSLICQGAEAAGVEVKVIPVTGATPSDVQDCDMVVLGCPSMGAEVLEESEFEPFIESIEGSISGKKMVLFGSYGWGDGEWMRDWTDRMEKAGANLVVESLIVNEAPSGESAAQCTVLGKALAGK